MASLQPYQQRVVDEKQALDEKRDDLDFFFGTTTFVVLETAEKERLTTQYLVMGVYSEILSQRIAAFKPS